MFFYLQHNIVKLRKNFNTNFTKLRKTKINEMNLFISRHKRLRQIQKDIIQLQQLIMKATDAFLEMNEIQLCDDERPDIDFNCDEIDPDYRSNRASNDENSNEKAFIRGETSQKMFMEALNQMMDGVLEFTWEEEIKKNPPEPLCLINPTPECAFTDQEQCEIQAYEVEMKQITKKREIYIDKLIIEQRHLMETIEVQTIQLNKCIQNILQSKIHTEFAISSEKLRILVASADSLRYKNYCIEENRIQLVQFKTQKE